MGLVCSIVLADTYDCLVCLFVMAAFPPVLLTGILSCVSFPLFLSRDPGVNEGRKSGSRSSLASFSNIGTELWGKMTH